MYGNILEQLNEIELPVTRLRQSDIYALLKNLARYNDVYKSAGAVHGCALCTGTEVTVFIEGRGPRHNAVDAIAGQMWLEGTPGNDKLFLYYRPAYLGNGDESGANGYPGPVIPFRHHPDGAQAGQGFRGNPVFPAPRENISLSTTGRSTLNLTYPCRRNARLRT